MGAKKNRNAGRQRVSVKRPTVLVGQVHGDRVHPRWALNMNLVVVRDKVLGHNRILGVLDSAQTGAHVATGRCKIVRDFLRHPSKPEWLWMVDSDATFEADILDRLLLEADPVERPIVGALAFGMKPSQGPDGVELLNGLGAGPVEAFPTLYLFDETGKTFRIWNYTPDAMVEVHGTGCHCLLVHRSVFENAIWDLEHPLPWFRSSTVLNGGEVSEDLFFCLNAKAAGYPIYVNTAAKTGHIKEIVVDETFYLTQRQHRPARPRVVLVPSRNADLLTATVAQLEQMAEEYDELVVAWNGDGECPYPGTHFDSHGQGIHEMWNWAFDNRPMADVAFLNDDLRLEPGCLGYMFEALRLPRPSIGAVCANYDGREAAPHEDLIEMRDICAGRYDGTGGFAGFCFAVSRDWVDTTGYRFPEQARWWFGDNDLLLSVRTSGAIAVMVLPARCEHLDGGGKTGAWDDPAMQTQLAADQAWFMAKWQPQAVAS